MKTCINCGAQIEEGNKFCPHCGTKIEAEVQEQVQEQAYQPYQPSDSSVSSAPAEAYPMKWHKFLMVVLILGAVSNIFTGFTMIIDPVAGSVTEDILFGIASVGLGVFQLFVRNRMAAFKKDSWKLLFVLYGAKVALDIVSMIATGESFFAAAGVDLKSSIYVYVISVAIYLLLNYKYYGKRIELFVK